jgi:hypothetical protein
VLPPINGLSVAGIPRLRSTCRTQSVVILARLLRNARTHQRVETALEKSWPFAGARACVKRDSRDRAAEEPGRTEATR